MFEAFRKNARKVAAWLLLNPEKDEWEYVTSEWRTATTDSLENILREAHVIIRNMDKDVAARIAIEGVDEDEVINYV